MSATRTLPILKAASDVVDAIRKRHPGLPEVVVVLGAPGRTKTSQIHGHFAPLAWKSNAVDANGEHFHEILLSGESLQRGGRDTVGTLLHEAAHLYCYANNIRDTSNGNRYHNKRFKDTAEKLFGLSIEKADTIGWSVTTVPDATAKLYEKEIKALDEAITVYRSFGLAADTATPKKQAKWVMSCPECNDSVPTGKKWFDRNQPMCGNHPEPVYYELDQE